MTLDLARGPLPAAGPAAISPTTAAAQTSAEPTLAMRESVTGGIGGVVLALEPEGFRYGVGGAGGRIGRGERLGEMELARGLLHQPEQASRDLDEESELLSGWERPGIGEGRPPTDSLEHAGAGDVAIDRADGEGLNPPRDSELAGGNEVDDRAGFGRHWTVARDGSRRRTEKYAGDGAYGSQGPDTRHPAH